MSQPHPYDGIESIMESLPDAIETALVDWKKAVIERKSLSAILYLKFKEQDRARTATEIRALVESSPEWKAASLKEAVAEGHHSGLYEKLMTLKKIESKRAAF